MRDMTKKIECPKCGKMFQSLGYASHRAMHRREREKNGSSHIMEEETYLSIKGASKQDIGDSAFHKNKGNHSDKTWSKMIDAQAEKDRRLITRREELRKEYWQKVQNGEFRPQTRNEKLIATANGHIDNECTIAARKILSKKGIDWRQF